MSQKSKGRYRSVVYAYLKDKSSSKCSKRFRPLIEEYRSYITDEEKIKEFKENVVARRLETRGKVGVNKKEEIVNDLEKSIIQMLNYSKQMKKLGATELKIKFDEVELSLSLMR